MVQDFTQDVRFAIRLLLKDRRFTLAAITALALGMAASTTVFTLINAALIRNLPFADPNRIVDLSSRNGRNEPGGISYADFRDLQASVQTFRELAAWTEAGFTISDDSQAADQLRGSYISANGFQLLGRAPLIGRTFEPADESPGAAAVVVLGYDIWNSRYGGSSAVIGRTIRVNGTPATIVGVMPERFRFPIISDAWQPLSFMPGLTGARRDARTLGVVGRLADGVTLDQARAELANVSAAIAAEHPDTNNQISATAEPMLASMRRSAWAPLMMLLGAVTFVLLIVCANVANLLLARAAGRSREIAIRSALGASRWRIVRQLLIESLTLATVAGAAGTLLAVQGVRYFGVVFDIFELGSDRTVTPFWVDLSMNLTVFGFVALICFGSSIAFGLLPALHASKTDSISTTGRGVAGSVRARRWTSGLMVGELALSLILLAGAGLMARSFVILYRAHLRLDVSNMVSARIFFPPQKYATAADRQRLVDRLEEQLAGDPIVESATIASDVPFVSLGATMSLALDGRAVEPGVTSPTVSLTNIGRRYFETLSVRPIRGRLIDERDAEPSQPGAVINQRFADMFFSGQDPIGRLIQLTPPRRPGAPVVPAPWLTIVGVVPTLPELGLRALASSPVAYMPSPAARGPRVVLVAKSPAGLRDLAVRLREHVRQLDGDLPIYSMLTVDDAIARGRYSVRIIGLLLGLLAMIGAVVSFVGLYALTAHGVAERLQEIGVRMALGATQSSVVWLFLRRAMIQLAVGLTAGLAGALAVNRLLQAWLVNTDSQDPLTLLLVMLLLATVSLSAALVPARRASRVDPATALRHD